MLGRSRPLAGIVTSTLGSRIPQIHFVTILGHTSREPGGRWTEPWSVSRASEFMQTQRFILSEPDHGPSRGYTEMNSEASSCADTCRGGSAIASSSSLASREGAASTSVAWREDGEVEKQSLAVVRSPL